MTSRIASTASVTGSGPRFKFIFECTAAGNLHYNYRKTLNLLTAENGETIRMIDARSKAAFAKKTLSHVGRIKLMGEHLQSHPAIRIKLLGFVHRAHVHRARAD